MDVSRPTLGVGAVVLAGDAVLVVRRAAPPRAGHWSLPGGKVVAGESLREAARREIHEETGLSVEVGALVGVVEVRAEGRHYVIVDFLARAAAGAPVAASDASEARFVPIAELGNLGVTAEVRRMVDRATSLRAVW